VQEGTEIRGGARKLALLRREVKMR